MTTEKSYTGWYFLGGVSLLYIIMLFIDFGKLVSSLKFFAQLIVKIIPILIFLFIIMALTNYFVKHKTLVRLMGKKSGALGWLIAIVTGILSSGPIYMWYPLLADLRKKGVRTGLIAVFLYNRAVKIPLLPAIIIYFGLKFTIILTLVMVIASIFQGLVIEKLMG